MVRGIFGRFRRRPKWGIPLPALLLVAAYITSPTALLAGGDKAGPQFALVDQRGNPVSPSELKGKPTLLQLGFTSCPVVCPTTLHEIAGIMEDLGPLTDELNFVFVTVDPVQDTPEVLKSYIEFFDRRIVGLTGTEANINDFANALGASISKSTKDGEHAVSHPVYAYLFDSKWIRKGTLYVGPEVNRGRVVGTLRALITSSKGS